MRGWLVLSLTAAVALGGSACASAARPTSGGSAVGAAAAAKPTCGPASGATLAENSQVRVYTSGGRVLGCARGHRRTYLLGQSRTCIGSDRVSLARVAGLVAAYSAERCGVDAGSSSVLVRRLTDGRTLTDQPAITGPGLVEAYQTVSSLVVTAGGAVAWIASEHSIVRHGSRLEVHSAHGRTARLLDSGPAIVPSSLSLHGETIRWRDGPRTRSAPI